MKFEKIMKNFSKDIGLDSNTLLNLLMGNSNGTNNEPSSNFKENSSLSASKDSRRIPDGGNKTTLNQIHSSEPINTGAAAQLAYNNLTVLSSDNEPIQQQN